MKDLSDQALTFSIYVGNRGTETAKDTNTTAASKKTIAALA